MILTESSFNQTVLQSDLPVMIDFWASWCPPCNAMTSIVEGLTKKMEGKAIVGKVNITEEQSLASQYNISAIPAFLFFKGGEVQKELTLFGIQSAAKLETNLESLM